MALLPFLLAVGKKYYKRCLYSWFINKISHYIQNNRISHSEAKHNTIIRYTLMNDTCMNIVFLTTTAQIEAQKTFCTVKHF